jgi:hypothetical protein
MFLAQPTQLAIIHMFLAQPTQLAIIHMFQGIPTQQDIIRTLQETIMGQARTPAPTTPILIFIGQITTQHPTPIMCTALLVLMELRPVLSGSQTITAA